MKHIRLPSGEYVEDRRNGLASRLVWTTMVSACGVVFLGFTAWMTSMNGHIAQVEATMNSRGERLATVETSMTGMESRLIRIEDKVDKLLGKK